jgi:hypothetical protein
LIGGEQDWQKKKKEETAMKMDDGRFLERDDDGLFS